VVILANARIGDDPGNIALHLLSGKPLPPAPPVPTEPKTMRLEAAVLDTNVGRYQLASGTILSVARKNEHLLVGVTGGGVSTFFAEGTREFFSNTDSEQIEFEVNADGLVTGLVLYEDGKETGKGVAAPRVMTAASVLGFRSL
jgi:hypothetical protein